MGINFPLDVGKRPRYGLNMHHFRSIVEDCAQGWVVATQGSYSTLSRKVWNNGSIFRRLAAGGDLTLASFSDFIRFMLEPENWPGGEVPADVLARCRSIDLTGTEKEAA
jgi:hypothetical protein